MRNYKKQGNQTSPENSGVKNMPEGYVEKNKADGNGEILKGLIPLFHKAIERRGTNWTPEEMAKAIAEFFTYCEENNVKVYKGGLAMWLGTHKQQIWEWENNPSKYGVISELIRVASTMIEGQYIGRAEQYPTANLFLLRTSHGHVETSKVDVNTTNTATTVDEVNELVAKLGFNKPKTE